jgi:hypothetical protein
MFSSEDKDLFVDLITITTGTSALSNPVRLPLV